jgi:uncharacterized protein
MPGNPVNDIVVVKLDIHHKETWRYSGTLIRKTADSVLLEANFNRPDKPFHGITMREGDRFVEKYYFDRWYNIFEIHDRDDDALKAWYCNISEPAEIKNGQVTYVDLALDLLVFPDRKQLVLDEDEFADLNLPEEIHTKAMAALEELKNHFFNAVSIMLD